MLRIFEAVNDNRLVTPQMTIVGGKKAPLTNKSGAKIDKQATLKAGRLRKFETSAGAVGKAQKTLRSATATKEQRDRAKATIKRAAEKMRSGGSGISFEKLHPRYPKGSPGGKGGKFMPKGSAEYKAAVANNLAVEVASGKATLNQARQAAKEAGIATKPELGEELGAMFKEADRIGKKYQDEPAKQAMDTLTPETAKKVKKAITGMKGGKKVAKNAKPIKGEVLKQAKKVDADGFSKASISIPVLERLEKARAGQVVKLMTPISGEKIGDYHVAKERQNQYSITHIPSGVKIAGEYDLISAKGNAAKETAKAVAKQLHEANIPMPKNFNKAKQMLTSKDKAPIQKLKEKVMASINGITDSPTPAKQTMDTLTPETAKKVKKAITGIKGGKVTKGTAPSNRNRQPAKISTPLGEFSNPVKSLTIPDYPLGGNKRGEMKFWVESHPTKGERIVKQSTGKPSYSTYAKKYAIVTGDDGRTYFLSTNFYSPYPTIYKTDFKHPQDYTKLIEDKALQPSLAKFIESAK